jgi:hypothetical protein
VSVLLHRRSAAGGIHGNEVDVCLLEGRDQIAREALRLLGLAGVKRQCATAPL